ncbi:MAG: CBS domain-containing protein [Deltaproteobacteria bacterium]|nr:CBS domain-containing protein [Deltaproteobacteria bacterium]
MKSYLVKDLMVPLSEYATVPMGSTLFEAVLSLEKAQEEFDHTKYKHRGVLILDQQKRVVGKLSHLHALRALEPMEDKSSTIRELDKLGFSSNFIRQLRKQRRQQAAPLEDLCEKAAQLKVEDFMHATAEDEFIDHEATLDMAIHQLVEEKLLSLMVTQGDNTIGILRLADVFAAVYHTMVECTI